MKKTSTRYLCLAALVVSSATSMAQTATWSGTTVGSTSAWSTATNWSTGVQPTSSTDIEFGNFAGSSPSTGNSIKPANNILLNRNSGNLLITLTNGGGGINASGLISSTIGASETSFFSGGVLSASNLTVNSAINLGRRGSAGTTASIGNVAISGTTTINTGGTLYAVTLAGTTDLGALNMGGGFLSLTAGSGTNGTVDNAVNAISVNRLSGSGTIAAGKALTTGSLSVSGSVNGSYSGVITDGSGTAALTKSGGSTLTLTGSNSYTGATTVTAGTLVVAGSLGNTATSVGGTGILSGTGSIGGAVTVNTGGQIAAGDSGAGRLTITNSVSLTNASTAAFEVNGATVATQYDQLRVTGGGSVFSLTGTNNLALSMGYTATNGTLIFLVDNQGSSAISGVFEQLNGVTTNLVEGAIFTISSQQFKIGYGGDVTGNTFTGGNDLVLQAVPEPAAWALLASGLVTLILFRRRRLT